MEYIADLFTLLFFLATFVYLFWGGYVIRLNLKADVNWAFLLVCIALSIWSFGFAMGNSADSIETVLFWRRFAAIGRVFVNSLNLHFMLLLIYKNYDKRKKQLFFLLHIPAIIFLWVFSLSTALATIQYDLVKIDYGWINRPINNGWDYFYFVYFISYSLASLFIVWNWRKNLKNKKLKNKKLVQYATLIFSSLFAAILLGNISAIILNSILTQPLPQMLSIFLLLPTWAMYYTVRHYDVMQAESPKQAETILTESDQKTIFRRLSLAFTLGSIFFFLSSFLPSLYNGNNNFEISFKKSIATFSIGAAIFFAQKIKNESRRDAFTIIVLVLSIPLIILQFADFSGETIWGFPFLIIISSLVFTKRTLLVSASIMAIITQQLFWIFIPENIVPINRYDYLLRMTIFFFAFLIGFHVNRVYVTKIKEHTNQIEFQKLSSQISYDFISLNQANFDEKINIFLKNMGLFFQADRTYLFLIDHDNKTLTRTHGWLNEGIEPGIDNIQTVSLSVFPWWIKQLQDHKMIYIEDVNQMPAEASKEQEQLIRQEVKSIASILIEGDKKIQGFFGIDSVTSYKKWSAENLEMLKLLGNLIAQGLIKKRSDEAIELMAYYDHLTGLSNRYLFVDRLNQGIYAAKRNQTLIAVIFIDLDEFKSVNDSIGHNGGDDLLKAVAEKLLNSVRKMDTISRFGGDEFVIMLENIKDAHDTLALTEKIMTSFSEPFTIQDQELFVTASAGIAVSSIGGADTETLIKNADIAMYISKGKGKNQCTLYTADMKKES